MDRLWAVTPLPERVERTLRGKYMVVICGLSVGGEGGRGRYKQIAKKIYFTATGGVPAARSLKCDIRHEMLPRRSVP